MIMNENISGSFSDCEYPGLYTYEPSPFVRFHDNRNHVHEISVPREIQGRRVLFVSSTYDEKEDDISILQSDAFDNDDEELQDTHILYSGGQQESMIDDARSTISRIACFENNIFDRVICQ